MIYIEPPPKDGTLCLGPTSLFFFIIYRSLFLFITGSFFYKPPRHPSLRLGNANTERVKCLTIIVWSLESRFH